MKYILKYRIDLKISCKRFAIFLRKPKNFGFKSPDLLPISISLCCKYTGWLKQQAIDPGNNMLFNILLQLK